MAWFPLENSILLEVSGKDSTRYLNARLTNDIKNLRETCVAAALTPQGRTEGVFTVYKVADERYLLLCTHGARDSVISAFKRYLVADRVTVRDLGEQYVVVHVTELDIEHFKDSEIFVIPSTRTRVRGADLVIPLLHAPSVTKSLEEASPPLSPQEQTVEAICAGIPRFDLEITPDMIFSEAKVPGSISYNKGCYAGQEVIEKIDSHGKLPRMIYRFSLPNKTTLSRGDEVLNVSSLDHPGNLVGNVITSAYDPKSNCTYCFALLKTRNLENDTKFSIVGHEAYPLL